MDDNIKGLRTLGHWDITDLCISFNAEEGPLLLSGEGDSPSILTLQLSHEAIEEASSLEVSVFFCYGVHLVNVHVCSCI